MKKSMATKTKTLPPLSRHRVRTQGVCDRLAELARLLGPEGKMPSVQDLCAETGVSTATLNDALNEMERRGVLYRVRGVGIFVAPTIKRNIAVVCRPSLFRSPAHSPFWDLLIEEIEKRAGELEEAVAFHWALGQDEVPPPAPPLPENLLHDLAAGRVQGLLSIGLHTDSAQWLVDNFGAQLPIVCYAQDKPHPVEMDGDLMMRQGVQTLVSCGCRRIAYLQSTQEPNGEMGASAHVAQLLESTHSELGLKPQRDLWRFGLLAENGEVLTSQEQGYGLALQVLELAPEHRPDGLLFADDLTTSGALAACRQLGLAVGKDILIATHSNSKSPLLFGYENDLILMEYDTAELVREMFSWLDELIDGTAEGKKSVVVRPHLRVGSNLARGDGAH
jgi:DNA-binding LacI/PurR family transcriptional regulator